MVSKYVKLIHKELPVTEKTTTIYLKNKDILAEIHRSKMSYCWKESDAVQQYDYIVYELKSFHNRKTKLCPEGAINLARDARASRLSSEAHKAAVAAWEEANGKASTKPKADQFEINPKKIPVTDLVVRVMTFDHIPLEPGRKNNPKSLADHRSKVNFPPFKHFMQNEDGTWREVLRSHWAGNLETGEFNKERGQITNRLGAMFLKLCERYSLRSNWRGYSYVDEMRGQALIQLTQIALQFDEGKSQNPFAYYTAAVTNSFTRVLNVEKRQRDIRDDMLQESGQMPSWTRQMESQQAHLEGIERFNALKESEVVDPLATDAELEINTEVDLDVDIDADIEITEIVLEDREEA
jgi:hypothetical protein